MTGRVRLAASRVSQASRAESKDAFHQAPRRPAGPASRQVRPPSVVLTRIVAARFGPPPTAQPMLAVIIRTDCNASVPPAPPAPIRSGDEWPALGRATREHPAFSRPTDSTPTVSAITIRD